VIKTLQAIEDANVVVLLLDAEHAITEQDAHLAGHILDAGRALVVAINKWDAADADAREQAKRDLERKMGFLSFAAHHFISARDGKGVGPVLKSVREAFASAMIKLPTPRLTRTLQLASSGSSRRAPAWCGPKLRYAHQGGVNPPLIVVHGTRCVTCPTRTAATWNDSSPRRSNCVARPLGYNSRSVPIRMRRPSSRRR
jgi:GTP-binding protein